MPNNFFQRDIPLYDEADEKRVHLLIQQWQQKRLHALNAAEKKLSQNSWLWFQPPPDENDKKPRTLLENLTIPAILARLRW